MSINKLDVNNTANDLGEWYINEKLDLAYFSVFASDVVPSDTSTDIGDNPWSAIDALTSLPVSVRTTFKIAEFKEDRDGRIDLLNNFDLCRCLCPAGLLRDVDVGCEGCMRYFQNLF